MHFLLKRGLPFSKSYISDARRMQEFSPSLGGRGVSP